MQKTFTFKRWVSTILAIVMLLGLVPTATLASAGGGTHGGSTGDAGAAGTNPQGWNWDYNAFSRYTLIKLPSGANNPSEYQVIGTVDIVDSAYENRLTDAPDSMLWVGTSYADGAYTKTAGMNTVNQGGARTFNSLDYTQHDASSLSSSGALYTSPGLYYGVGQSEFASLGAKLFEAYKEAFPDSQALKERPELFDPSKLNGNIIGSFYKEAQAGRGSMAHINQFGTKTDQASTTNRGIYEENTNWNALLLMLSTGMPPKSIAGAEKSWIVNWLKTNKVDYLDFEREENCDYRVIVEAGTFAMGRSGTGNKNLMVTLRDIALLGIGSSAILSSIYGSWASMIGDSIRATCNEFEVYDAGILGDQLAAGDKIGEALDKAITGASQHTTFQPVPNAVGKASDSTSMQKAAFAMLKNYPSYNLGNLKKDGAYGMAVISPYFFAGFATGVPLTIEKKVVGTDDGRDWPFRIEFQCSAEELAGAGEKGARYRKNNGEFSPLTSPILEFTLKNGEKMEFNNLPEGISYTVTETAANSNGYTTTVKTGTTSTPGGSHTGTTADGLITFENSKGSTPLTVRKTVSGKGDKSKAFSFSALFDFSGVSAPATVKFSKSGSVQNLTVSGTRINHTFTLKNGESGVFEGLPIGTKYTVSETDPDEHTVTISGGTAAGYSTSGTTVGNDVLTFNNSKSDETPPPPSPGIVRKVDQDGNGIGPATFHFKSLTNSVNRDIACDAAGTLTLQWSDPLGENYIAPGEYTVTEKIPPVGFVKTDEVQNLRLWLEDKNGDGVEEPYSSGPIVFANQPKHTIIIQKVDKTGAGLPGAVFEVRFNGAKIDTITTEGDGTFTYAGTDGEGLSAGTYEFIEITPPAGFVLPYQRSQSVTIDPEHDEVREHTLTFTNYEYPEIVIQKVSAGTEQPLAGAVFEVKIDETPIGTFGPTGPDGTIIIDHDTYGKFLNENQESWTVSVREVQAPDGYLIDDTDWKSVEFHRGQEMLPFVFTDTGYPEIVIRKSDRETEERLEGATFDIKIDAGASFSLTKQTDENGEIHITYDDYERFIGDIVWDRGWTVAVTETVMPDKYNRDPQPESDGGAGFTVTKQLLPGQTLLEFDFTDTHYRDLLVVKSDASNSWRLADAKFKLESINLDDPAAGGTVSREGATDANGELLFEDLPNGTYKLTELTPPTGYDMPDPHEWTVTVTSMSDRVIQIAVENEPREGLTITKHDAITGKPLAGVEFSIRYLGDGNDSTNTSNEPRTYTTDSNGIIHLPDAVPGWYQIIETRVPDGYIIDSEPRLVQLVNAHDTVVVNYHNYQDTQLIILKKDNQTGLPLAGARFMVTTAGGNFIADLVTGSTGYATLNGLEPGSYVVKEVEAPDGHIIDSTPQAFELRVGQTEPVFLVFGNDGKTTLYIRKEDAQTRLPVAGAVFKLSRVNGEVIKDRLETGMDGLASIGDLLPGDYVVEEIEAPKGYLLSENPKQNVSLKAGEVATVLFRNNKPGGVAILKQDAMSGLPLEGAKFTVTRLDGSPVGKEPYYVTGKDGYIRVPDLEAGYYYVQEIEAPEGYLLDNTRHQVRVENFEVTLLQLKNYEKTTLVVEKVDAQSKVPLAGAEFGLFAMDGKQIGDTFITGANGKANLTGIEPGWYILKELKAPIGYVLNEEEFRVEIKEGQPTTITVPNTPESGITVRKVDASTKNPLAGAQFELRDQNDKLLGSYQTDPTGSFVTVNVGPGTYYLIETKAPAGYTIANERTEVKVAEGEKPVVIIENHKDSSIQILKTDSVSGKYLEGAEFEVRELNTNRVVGAYTTDQAGIAFTEPLPAGNYIVTEIKAPCGYILDETHHHVEVKPDTPSILRVTNTALTGIMITKVSTVDDEPLMGAKFEIRTAEGRVLGEVTTDTTGTATYPIATPGVYYVKEVEQPDGYLLDETVHRVEVVEGQLATLVVENAPLASLVIFKGDADTGRGVAGAVFEVYHADGAFIGRYTTDAQGEALIRPIEPGHYIVREVAAPDGYELPNVTEKTITVKAGQINRVTFEDLAYGSLIVRLEDAADGSPLANGRFQLIAASTGTMIKEGVTANDGSIHWGNLPTGDYLIKQTYAPDGYTMTTTEKRETVVSNEPRTVVFQNVTSGIVIEKLDRVTSAPLPNARFQVTRDSDNIVIGEYVTDEDGLALVGGLTPGMYTVEELAAPTGYEMDAPSQLVHVKASEFAHATFTDTPYAGITINAVDQSNKPLAGATIEIYRQNGELINTWTTDNTGIVQTDKLTSGYYVIKVIKSPDGYTPNVTETTVQIQNGVAVNVRLVFNAGGTLNIYGVDAAEKGLAGMRVEVTTIEGTKVGTYTTDAAGIIRVPGLDAGWYVVTVTRAPDGYTLSEVNQSQNVEITSDGTAQVRFQFGKTYGVQIRTSVSQTGAMVPGVEYKVTKLDGSVVGAYTSDKAGLAYVDLAPGWYVIEQTRLPKGYENYALCAKRNVEVKADQPTIVDFVLTQLSGMRVKVVDGTSGSPIYGVKLVLKDGSGKIVDEYTTNNEGCITLRGALVDGTYTLTMISVPNGYTVDTVPKTIEVLNGQTAEVVWKLYNQAGQIQVHLTSTAYNATLDLAAGSNLPGAVFEIYDPFSYVVLATIETDSYGVAASPGLPIGRYIIREKTPAPYFGLSGKETEVYIKINNDVVRVEYQAAPMNLKVTHTVAGNANASAGSFSKYLFKAANNDSGDRLDNFFLNITIPTDAVRGGTLFTGKWSSDVAYNISYKTNMNDYRPMATGLSSASSYQYDLSSLALDVQSGEYVTDVRFEFGTVPAGFKVTSAPVFYGYVMPAVPNGYIIMMRSECGGQYNGYWKTESALCTTNVVNNNGGGKLPSTLPKTGY